MKSANVVLGLAFTPKLIDCGLSKFIPDQQRHGTIMSTCGAILGTPGYTCPKYASGGSEYDAKSENFSFGMESFCLSCFWEDCKARVKMTSLPFTLNTFKMKPLCPWTWLVRGFRHALRSLKCLLVSAYHHMANAWQR